MQNHRIRQRRIPREVDTSPPSGERKRAVAEIRDYYRRKAEALEKGLPLPEPPGVRSPLDAEKK